MDGDYVIGGVFSMHSNMHTGKHNYTTMPEPLSCAGSIDSRGLRFSRAMVFAIEQINNSTELLPGIKLGYEIYDSCASVSVAVHVAFQLSGGMDRGFNTGDKCSQSGMVMGVVGASESTPSISVSRIIGPFNIPQVSHFATCACLSDKQQYPSFFRTIPSDQFQADALAKLVKHFGWTWIGAVWSDSDYGNNGMASFLHAARKEGICVEYSESFYRTHPRSRIQRVADVIRRSTAKVVVAFISTADMKILLEELSRKPSPPRQWIGSESWVTDPDMLRFSFLAGAIGFGIEKSVIPGLRDFLLDLSPSKVADSALLTMFWEEAFNCRLVKSEATDRSVCDGTEDIKTLQSSYTDTSQLRVTNMVYKAVYAIAHAIHNAVCQKTDSTTQCDKFTKLEAKEVLNQLKKVNFSQNGYDVSFDANGDPVATYELVNWQRNESGSIELVTVGRYDSSLPVGQEFLINRNLTWVESGTQVPVSVCTDSCPSGTRKVLQKGKPICCYDCTPCPEGEISNATDSFDCFPCPKAFWPNAERDTCLPKPVEFLSFNEPLGIVLAAFSIGGACLAIITAAVFYRHRSSPIVRANNSELSFLLLFSLTLCFLCSLTFIGAPSEWSCMLRHTAFGITFVLCMSCVLGKTIVVLTAFRATLPGSNLMKWFGPSQQRLTAVSFTFIQVLICTIWLVLSPPFPMKNLTTYKERIILECALGSALGFWAVLGYIGLLAVFCFVLAVLARKLPNNFNEAKLITFSMLIFCAVWITFIPAYVSSPGKYTVAVEIFAILASSFGLITCIFAPKCFIILFKPEKNTKKHLMSRATEQLPQQTPAHTLQWGCVLSPLLYSLYTHDCSPAHPENIIVKFADDTTVVGLISGGDESAYRSEVLKLSAWCSVNNLALNPTKTKDIIVDFRRNTTDLAPLYIYGECVERVHTFKFLGVLITNNLSWKDNTTAVIKKAQQRLHFLRVLRKNNLATKLLVTFYRSTIESLLTYCITVWYASCTEADRMRLQRVVKAAQRIIGCLLPSLMDIYTSRCLSRAKNIVKDNSHPGFHLFNLLPSGRRYRLFSHICMGRNDSGPKGPTAEAAVSLPKGRKAPSCPAYVE
ncbi:vomeronasal type-2 receptor 1-like, partial [Trematomus bernacchii]|uniref:vomeronasal type-2 receptor 1-like n=1 Tax=Trematomus bernacchii TaxID=40690 RepID=UPI001469E241